MQQVARKDVRVRRRHLKSAACAVSNSGGARDGRLAKSSSYRGLSTVMAENTVGRGKTDGRLRAQALVRNSVLLSTKRGVPENEL